MNYLVIAQAVLGIILSSLILLQNRGAGLGGAWGGGGMSYHSRRGMEELINKATIVSAGLFIAVSIYALVA